MVPASPADAVNLAGDLETLMDSFTTEGIDWHALELAVDADFSELFPRSRATSCRSSSEYWPQILAERQASDPAQRRGALIEAEARRLTRERPDHADHRRGLDRLGAGHREPHGARSRACPEAPWCCPASTRISTRRAGRPSAALGDDETDPVHSHPQATLRRLLDSHLRVAARRRRRCWARCRKPARARNRLLSEALRPADTTDRWSLIPADERCRLSRERLRGPCHRRGHGRARGGASPSRSRCAKRIAHPHRTAALVTPDRALAARVTAELARWDYRVEDSAGMPALRHAGRTPRAACRRSGGGRLAARAGCWRCSRIRSCASAVRAKPWSMRRACSKSACCAGPRPAHGIDGHARGSGDTSRREGPPRAARRASA